jgi:hypothetical protein
MMKRYQKIGTLGLAVTFGTVYVASPFQPKKFAGKVDHQPPPLTSIYTASDTGSGVINSKDTILDRKVSYQHPDTISIHFGDT